MSPHPASVNTVKHTNGNRTRIGSLLYLNDRASASTQSGNLAAGWGTAYGSLRAVRTTGLRAACSPSSLGVVSGLSRWNCQVSISESSDRRVMS